MAKAKWTKPGWEKPANLRRNPAAGALRELGRQVVPNKRRKLLDRASLREAGV